MFYQLLHRTTGGELIALVEFGVKRRLVGPRKIVDVQKIQVVGGHLSIKAQDTKDVARELAADKASGGHNLQVTS